MNKTTSTYVLVIAVLSVLSIHLYRVNTQYYNIISQSAKEMTAIDSILTSVRKNKTSTVASIDSSLLKIDSLKNVLIQRADSTISYEDATTIITGK